MIPIFFSRCLLEAVTVVGTMLCFARPNLVSMMVHLSEVRISLERQRLSCAHRWHLVEVMTLILVTCRRLSEAGSIMVMVWGSKALG